jgi:PAS domain S-box-containing protein
LRPASEHFRYFNVIAFSPFLCMDCAGSDPGTDRLIDALRSVVEDESAPASLHSRVFDRIDIEPARVETDVSGRITAINPAFSKLCGYGFAEIQGRRPGSFLQGPETEESEVLRIRQAIRAGLPVDSELTNYHKDGSPYRVRIVISPVENVTGQLVGFRAVETKLG